MFDSSGNLWVADSYNNRVVKFTAPFSDEMPATLVLGQKDFESTAAGIGASRLSLPMDAAFDRNGNLWIADLANNRVLAFAPPFHNGTNASLVVGQPDFSSTGSNTTQNRLIAPYAIAFDASGNLWVADAGNSRVLEFQQPFSTGMNASLVIGQPDFTHNYCITSSRQYNETCGTRRMLNAPSKVAFDPSGDLWVGEGAAAVGRILEFKPPFENGMEAALVFGSVYPSAIAFDSAGNLWLGRLWSGVFEYKPPFNEHSIQTADGVPKNWSLTLGTYPGERADLPLSPTGFAFDSAGNLWVVDFRATWMLGNVVGRVLGFDAHDHVHQVNALTELVYFDNQAGLLAPLTWVPISNVGPLTFPEGLFNFTIQGLEAGGSVNVTITFPDSLPTGIGWWNLARGNPLGDGELEFSQLPASQTRVNGNNMTLTLTNASEEGVISVLGGPAVPPITSRTVSGSVTRTSSTNPPQQPISATSSLMAIPLAIVIVAIAFVLYRKRSTKPRRH